MSDEVRIVQQAMRICMYYDWPIPDWMFNTLKEAEERCKG